MVVDITNLNPVQKKSFELIQADARFIDTLFTNLQKPKTNFAMMFLPYLGIFADGTEQWGKKVNLKTPKFSASEKQHYTAIRNSIKMFDTEFNDLNILLNSKLTESEDYFLKTRTLMSKLINFHYNVGCDLNNHSFLGNTILCSIFAPSYTCGDPKYGEYIRDASIIAGELAAAFGCREFPPYEIDNFIPLRYKDYNFFVKCPLKRKTDKDFSLFSILCNINYIRIFIDRYIKEDCPSKLRYAYLQYHSLVKLVPKINESLSQNFSFDTSFASNSFRNCMAHYGLGVVLKESDIIENDLMAGLTNKIFNMPYSKTKKAIFKELDSLSHQIESYLFYDMN